MAQQGRVQTPGLQTNVRLRPAPMQSDTYAAPARVQGDQNLSRLSDALGSFSNSLGNLVPLAGAVDKERRQREDAMFQKRIAGQTLEETRKEISEGRMSITEDKFANAARQSIYGQKWAQSEAAAVDQELLTNFDWDTGNPEEYLAKHFQESIEASGLTDPNAIASASRAWDQYKSGVLEKQNDYRIKRTQQSTVDSAFTVIQDKAQEWIGMGMKPSDFAENLNWMRSELGVKGPLGADGAVLDQEYLNAADRLATTNPEYAIAMLDAEYQGRGGKTSLSAQREYRDRVLQIKSQASVAIGKREDANKVGAASNQADELLMTDHLDRVTDFTYFDHNGEQKTIPAKQQKEEALARYMLRSPEIAAANKEAPQQTLARELRKSQAAGLEHPRLKATVTGIASAATPDVMQDPEAMGNLMEKVHTARWLQDTSKTTFMAYLDDADRDILEGFRLGKEDMTAADGRQMSDQEALDFAIRTSKPVSIDGLNFTREQNDAIDRSVKSLATKPGWLWGTNTTTPWNSKAGENRVATLAKRLVQSGVDGDKAIEMASKSVARNSVTYNGMLLNVGKAALPDNYSESLDDIIGDFAKKNPGIMTQRELSTSDISISPVGDINNSGGRFMLFDKEHGVPVIDDKTGQPFFVTLDSLRQYGRAKEDRKFRDRANEVTINGAASARGLTRREDANGNPFFVNPDTRETFTITVPEDGGNAVVTNRGQRLRGRGNPVQPEPRPLQPRRARANN